MKTFFQIMFGFFTAIVLIIVLLGISLHKTEEAKIAVKTNTDAGVSEKVDTPRQAEVIHNWDYSSYEDKMGGNVKSATTQSLNEVDFQFPYNGRQSASLALRVHPRYGKDVMLFIEKGQFLCSVYACKVTVRFDKGKSMIYPANEPNDNSTTYIFIDNYKGFVANLLKAKKVYIEATFYQEGNQIFEFDVAGLKW